MPHGDAFGGSGTMLTHRFLGCTLGEVLALGSRSRYWFGVASQDFYGCTNPWLIRISA